MDRLAREISRRGGEESAGTARLAKRTRRDLRVSAQVVFFPVVMDRNLLCMRLAAYECMEMLSVFYGYFGGLLVSIGRRERWRKVKAASQEGRGVLGGLWGAAATVGRGRGGYVQAAVYQSRRINPGALKAVSQAAEGRASQPMMGRRVPRARLPQVMQESRGRAQLAHRCRCEHGWNTTATRSLPHSRHVRRRSSHSTCCCSA